LQIVKKFSPKIVKGDGIKLIFNEKDWCVIRKSGTENKLRIYIETQS